MDILKEIYQWQVDAGNTANGYDDFLESSFQIEEALEGFKDIEYLQSRLHSDGLTVKELCTPKECSRQIVKLARMDDKSPISDVERFDKHLDGIVFHIGSLAKLGLTIEQIYRGLDAVNTANKAKLQCPRDEVGKLLKPANFNELFAPEPKLQAILNERK